MPTCPGCQQHVSHDQLPHHERQCVELQPANSPDREAIQHLETQVEDVRSELDSRLQTLESQLAGGGQPGAGADEAGQDKADDFAQRLLEKDL